MSNKSRNEKIELLERFAMFLEKSGYTDVDWRTEPPFAIDEFMKLEKLTPHSVDGEFKHNAANFWKDKSDELKDLVWRLDREIWARVENKTASSSWARFASAELILQYIARRDGSATQEPKQEDDTMCPGCGVKEGRQHQEGCPSPKTDFEEMFKSSKLFKEPEPEQPSEQEQRELFSLIYRIMDQGGRPEDRFVIYRKGSEPSLIAENKKLKEQLAYYADKNQNQ